MKNLLSIAHTTRSIPSGVISPRRDLLVHTQTPSPSTHWLMLSGNEAGRRCPDASATSRCNDQEPAGCCSLPDAPFGDWLICGISTQSHQQEPQFDELVDASDSDFDASGLKAASIIRLGFLAVMPASRFLGVIGSISNERRLRLLNKLSEHLRAQ